MFHAIGKFAAQHPWTIGALWLAAGLTLAFVAPSWDTQTQDDDVRFVPDRFTSVRAHQLLEKTFPDDVNACKIAFALERDDRELTDADMELVRHLKTDLDVLRDQQPALKIGKTETCEEEFVGFRLISNDRRCTLVQVSLGTPYLATATQSAVEEAEKVVRKRLAETPDAPKCFTTGAAGIGRDLTLVAGQCLDGTTWATIALVIVVLLGVYRAPLLALIPLVTIAISVWVALNLLALMTMLPGVHLVNISKLFAIVILYGAGTDYCLFLISRYREELVLGHAVPEAIRRGVGGVGEALAGSAGTVMVGMGLMALAEFAKVRYAGPAIALSLGVALVASLTLTPALLRVLGPVAFWPGPMPNPRQELESKHKAARAPFWDRMSRLVQRRPLFIWVTATACLLPFVILGFQVEPSYRATGELSPETQSLQGLEAIQRHFVPGEIGPVTIALVAEHPWDSDDGKLQIEHLSAGFTKLDNVAEVRSLTRPLGFALPLLPFPEDDESLVGIFLDWLQTHYQPMARQFHEHAKKRYLSTLDEAGKTEHVTLMHVVLKTDPFDPASVPTLKQLRLWLDKELPRSALMPGSIRSEIAGVTSNAYDLATVTESDRSRVNTFVLLAIFVILLVLVRRFWLACYLLITVLASYYAALGATCLAGYFWTGAVLTSLDWRVPFFLFTILIAVGEDYNILLLSRALEEKKKHGSVEGMRRALAKTGGAITSCGLIMAGTFATLMLAGLNTLLQIGFALAFGVLIDTFVVRPFLVPAFTMMFWKEAKDPVPEGKKKNPKKAALERIMNEDWLEAA